MESSSSRIDSGREGSQLIRINWFKRIEFWTGCRGRPQTSPDPLVSKQCHQGLWTVLTEQSDVISASLPVGPVCQNTKGSCCCLRLFFPGLSPLLRLSMLFIHAVVWICQSELSLAYNRIQIKVLIYFLLIPILVLLCSLFINSFLNPILYKHLY